VDEMQSSISKEPQHCIDCDLEVPDGSRFCPHCGFNLRVLTEELTTQNRDDDLLIISGILLILIGISTAVSSALMVYHYVQVYDEVSGLIALLLMQLMVLILIGGITAAGGTRAMTGNNFSFVIVCSILALSSHFALSLVSYYDYSSFGSYGVIIGLAALIFIVSIRDRFVS